MLIDARTMPEGQTLFADLCIVGAGVAGITLAHALRASGLSIILAEAGDRTPDPAPAPIFGGETVNPLHPPIALYRSRCLGGTSVLWGGRCAPLEALDFERRLWVPFSGWPISPDDLAPAYRRAMEYCDLGKQAWRAREATGLANSGLIPGWSDPAVIDDALDRFSPPVNFGKRFGPDLAVASSVRLLLNANALKLHLTADGNEVESLEMASLPGRGFTILARAYVLAAGGLETTRLLLLSDEQIPGGIGNGHDLLGRFYMCHLQGKSGVIRLRRDLKDIPHRYERDKDGVYCRRRLHIAEEEQRRLGLLGFSLRYEHPAIPDPSHRSGILSAMYLSRHMLKKEYARSLATCGINGETEGPAPGRLAAHLRNVILDSPALLRFALDWFPKRNFAARRLPYVVLPNRDNSFHLDYYAEQAPNPDSRVTLTAERDPFGRRRLKVDWRTTALDHDSLAAGFRLIKERLIASGLGDLDYDEAQLRGEYGAIGGHHIGCTRMADHPSRGVADADGRVFGTTNLFIASASLFPTSGHASPTFTTAALALRLADHLTGELTADRAAATVAALEGGLS